MLTINVFSVVCAVVAAWAVLWLFFRIRWVRAINRLPRRSAARGSFWLADLDIWRAPAIPGTGQPDVLPLLARFAAKLREDGHGLGALWLFNPLVLPFARPLIVMWDPELIREVLEPKNYAKFNKGSFYSRASSLLGDGLQSASDGSLWTCQRHLAQQGFSPQVMDEIVPAVKTRLDFLFMAWDKSAAKKEPVPIYGDIRRLALDVFAKLELGHEIGALEAPGTPPLLAALDLALESFDQLGRASPFLGQHLGGPLLGGAVEEVDALAREIIKQGQEAANKNEQPAEAFLLKHLLWSMVGPEGRTPLLGQQMVLDNVKTFLLAGHDTTASSLGWALSLLSRNRGAQDRLREEVGQLFKDVEASGEVLGAAALRKLRFLDAVIKETLRLYPAMAVARAPAWTTELGPTSRSNGQTHTVPRGCDILILPYLTHRDPALWPQPDAFDPERWLDKAGASRPCAYLPFGFGRRGCIGQEFAMTEMRAALAYIVSRYEVRPDPAGPEPRPVLRFSITPSPFSLCLERRATEKNVTTASETTN